MELETVKVKCEVTADNEQGFYIINKEDFDAEKHELFVQSQEKEGDGRSQEVISAAVWA